MLLLKSSVDFIVTVTIIIIVVIVAVTIIIDYIIVALTIMIIVAVTIHFRLRQSENLQLPQTIEYNSHCLKNFLGVGTPEKIICIIDCII